LDAPTIELHLWDIETKTIIRQWNLGDTDLHYLLYPSMTPDDQIVLVGDDAGNVYLIHKECTEILHKFKAHNALGKKILNTFLFLKFDRQKWETCNFDRQIFQYITNIYFVSKSSNHAPNFRFTGDSLRYDRNKVLDAELKCT
jgi:hypothetical protein